MKDDRFYIGHMLDCIANVEEDTSTGKEEFLARRTLRDAVMRNLQLLTESSMRVSDALKAEFPAVGWRDVRNFRNVAVHDYAEIDFELIWRIVSQQLPALKTQLLQIETNKNAG